MTASRAFGAFAIAFAVAYPVIYILAEELNFALFTYHPAIGEFAFGPDKARGAPVMYWYGWIATSTIGALVIATIVAYLPEQMTRRMPAALAWAVPAAAMVTAGGLMAHFFLR